MSSRSDAETILWQFNALQSKQSRNAVVDRLPALLRTDELRVLKDLLSSELFQRDILGSLPLETVCLIAEYLELPDIFLLQRVCKQWRHLLSSTAVQSAVLNRRCRTKLHIEPSQVHRALRRRILLERGQPFSVTFHFIPSLQTESHPPIVNYSEGRFAWLDAVNTRRIILVQDFQLDTIQHFCTENREPFVQVRVSGDLVAAVSSRGYCHVWDRFQNTASFRLPSMQFRFFVLGGRTIALSFVGYVLLWNFESRRTSMITVDSEVILLTLNPKGGSLTVVQRRENRPVGDDAWLRITKYALNPEADRPFQELSVEKLPWLFKDTPWRSERPDFSTSPMNELSHKGIACIARMSDQTLLYLVYDKEMDEVLFQVAVCNPAARNSLASIGQELMIQLDTVNSNQVVEVYSHGWSVIVSKWMGIIASKIHSRNLLLGDGQFVVLVNGNEVTAWCLDDRRQPPRASPVTPLFD